MRCLLLIVLAGCSTMSLRIGGVMVGDRAAFQASVEVGTAIGDEHSIQITHDHGVEAASSAGYMTAFDVDYVVTTDRGPLARIGPRVRASEMVAAVELRSTVFTGLFAHETSGSGGLGVELAGGYDGVRNEPVYEVALVMHSRWPLD